MCYPEGSIEQAVNVCPMCKVFPHSRCPHVREVCRNRANHPRIDVLYLKNAEVDCFNGCGFCKWARTNPPPKSAGYNNPGWPGCCRPPASGESKYIQLAEWKAVGIVHHVPIPPEVKAALDSLSNPKPASSASSNASRSPTSKPVMPSLDRRSSGGSPPTKSSSVPSRTATSAKGRTTGGSPKQSPTSLSGSLSRSTGAALSASMSSSAPMSMESRRAPINDATDKSRSAHSSPSRKQLDLDNPATPRRNSASRSSSTPSSKGTTESRSSPVNQSPERRRTAPSSSTPVSSAKSSTPRTSAERERPAPANFTTPRSSSKKDDNMSSASSTGGDSRSSSDYSDSTSTADGGFTDYLSDESEAELQRQAEAKAALIAQMQAEELEFKAARQQLAHVDLRPPKSWTPTNITNSTVPRLAQQNGAKS